MSVVPEQALALPDYLGRDFFLRQLSQYAFILCDLRTLSSLEKRGRFLAPAALAVVFGFAAIGWLGAWPLSSRVIWAISSSICFFLFSSDSSANSNILFRSLMRTSFRKMNLIRWCIVKIEAWASQ
jgi:hypothetical protein